jgi:hypothetical protein
LGEFETKFNYILNIGANQEKCGDSMQIEDYSTVFTTEAPRHGERFRID